tara:strand:- start:107 stop:964 length:858 start_codon:yes stop_codon:yes gene_type:complete
MFSKSLLLSLGITSLASIAIYFYFTQRIKKNEQKMDLIFDIIQEHKKTTEIIYERLNNTPHINTTNNSNNNGLINVSDTEPNHNSRNQQNTEAHDDETDDESDDYTDSEVVSDNESIKSLKIRNENLQQDSLNLQQLPFNINGADSTNTSEAMMMMMGSIQLSQNLFETTEENNDQVEIEYVNENTHEENNMENLQTTETIQETLSEENVQLHNELPVEKPVIDNIENETASEISNVTASNIEPDVDIHNPKTTVAQLKALAKSKNLRYRGLRKDKLVELLDNNM